MDGWMDGKMNLRVSEKIEGRIAEQQTWIKRQNEVCRDGWKNIGLSVKDTFTKISWLVFGYMDSWMDGSTDGWVD